MQSSNTNRSSSRYGRSSGSSGSRDQRRPQRRQYRRRRPKVCEFCVAKVDTIDYKRIDILEKSLTERGKIKGRRKTGTCAKHQRRLATAVKRARFLALVPYTAGHVHTGQPTARPMVLTPEVPEVEMQEVEVSQVTTSEAQAQEAVASDGASSEVSASDADAEMQQPAVEGLAEQEEA